MLSRGSRFNAHHRMFERVGCSGLCQSQRPAAMPVSLPTSCNPCPSSLTLLVEIVQLFWLLAKVPASPYRMKLLRLACHFL